MNKNLLREIVENIMEAADELRERESGELDPMEFGQLLAYAESLCIIRDALAGYELEEIGLDFDIDERYLH